MDSTWSNQWYCRVLWEKIPEERRLSLVMHLCRLYVVWYVFLQELQTEGVKGYIKNKDIHDMYSFRFVNRKYHIIMFYVLYLCLIYIRFFNGTKIYEFGYFSMAPKFMNLDISIGLPSIIMVNPLQLQQSHQSKTSNFINVSA